MKTSASDVRLDIENEAALLNYLRVAGHVARDDTPAVRVLMGGVSNRAVLVERAESAFVVKQSLEKLRVAVDWYSDPDRIFREAAALRALSLLLPAGSVPAFLFEDRNARLFAMSAVPESAENWKTMLLAGALDPELVRAFGMLLGTMHRTAFLRDAELQLSIAFGDRALFESLRVEPYYAYSAAQEPRAGAFLSALIDDVRRHTLTFVHGDYSPKNVLVDRGRLVLLDFEVAHWGDPAFDVGFGMTHLLSKAHHLPHNRTAFAEANADDVVELLARSPRFAVERRGRRPRRAPYYRVSARARMRALAAGIPHARRADDATRRRPRTHGRAPHPRRRSCRRVSRGSVICRRFLR